MMKLINRRRITDLSPQWNNRRRMLLVGLFAIGMIAAVLLGSLLLGSTGLSTNLSMRNQSPTWQHPFGTDWLGRDMFVRTVKGLALSVQVGLIGALCSTIIAALMGLAAASLGKLADRLISWLIDLMLSVPHLVTLILIAFVSGGGLKGIVIGIAVTHWPTLARIIRAEAMQLRCAEYVQLSRRLGRSGWWTASRHILPHIMPQLLVGLLLLFPHAILHEAAITFIGLGLSPHQPAIGIILSESMRYLSNGMWWLALFPGLCLLIIVQAFDRIGHYIRAWIDPRDSQL